MNTFLLLVATITVCTPHLSVKFRFVVRLAVHDSELHFKLMMMTETPLFKFRFKALTCSPTIYFR